MKLTQKQATKKHKYGVDMKVYKTNTKKIGVVYENVKGGHFEEFYHKKSTYIYYILNGSGRFYLNGKCIKARSTDIVIAPPFTKIYFLGKMKLLLLTVPAWEAKHEVHVRNISR